MTIRPLLTALALFAAPLCEPTHAAGEQQAICSHAKFREFDFWAGAWRVQDATGNPAGENSITIEQGGCVLVESWRSARGGTGQSLNYFDPVTKAWKQRWVGLGLILEMQGGIRDGAMVLEGPLHYVRTGRTTLLRGTWSKLADGRVRQLFVESADQGKTWAPWFDGYYSRAESSSSH
jgi:hypothetical protein